MRLLHWLEYLGGAREETPAGWPRSLDWLVTGVTWGASLAVIACCCGQTSKFIYIDF